MTNEELTELIQAGQADLLAELWEQTEKLINCFMTELYRHNQQRAIMAGVVLDDVLQESYFVLLAAVKAYAPEKGLKLSSYFKLHAKTRFYNLIGMRTERQAKEPLNNYTCIDEPITQDGDSLPLSELLEDKSGSAELEAAEHRFYIQQLRTALNRCLEIIPRKNADVIKDFYFNGRSIQEISGTTGVSPELLRKWRTQGLQLMKRGKCLMLLKPYAAQVMDNNSVYDSGYGAFNANGGSVAERIAERQSIRDMLAELERQYITQNGSGGAVLNSKSGRIGEQEQGAACR